MVDLKTVEKQLKRIKFDTSVWNRSEKRELSNILLPDEVIKEGANGIYENGFALLVATDMRVLLIDKKPLNFLTVEDLRFDTINEIDYSHRLLGATITISAGNKTLRFRSYNQPRLRRLINLVQYRMQEIKKEAADKTENQQQHLEDINKQLQMYLLAQHQQLQQQLQNQKQSNDNAQAAALKPAPQLSDYLFAQRLLEQFQNRGAGGSTPAGSPAVVTPQTASAYGAQQPAVSSAPLNPSAPVDHLSDELVAEGQKEIFGKALEASKTFTSTPLQPAPQPAITQSPAPLKQTITSALPQLPKSLEINALKIAYSKLPMMLRNRKFVHSSYQASLQAQAATQTQVAS